MARRNESRLDRAVEAALWLKELRETNNETFLPLFWDKHRYLVLKGGGGSGKSIFAGRKILERAATEPGHRFLVVRKVANTLRNSCFKQLKSQAYNFYAEQVAKIPQGETGDMYIKFKNGSEILFAGLDDVEKLKSIFDITGIWIEEASEILESDFNQLDIRLRTQCPYYLQFIITFNPISITHWLKRRFFDLDISDPQTRDKFRSLTKIHESTYQDNRFLSQDGIRTLENFKYTDPYYYRVYCLGEWGVTGKSVFDAEKVTQRLLEKIKTQAVGDFTYTYDGLRVTDIRWTENKAGGIQIYKPPETGVPYVIGGDTAGDGSDSFVPQVLDNRTGEQVAKLRQTYDEDLFAKQIFCLGMHYNKALIGIETNYSTFPVMELERLRYPRQYVRESIDDYTHKVKKSYGFQTNTKTRPVIIAGLVEVVRESAELICDQTTLEEMLTFVRNEDGRAEAEDGAHDDCVMALAIAHYIRPQQRYLQELPEGKKQRWTADMWEDYRRASPEDQAYLRKKWGTPM